VNPEHDRKLGLGRFAHGHIHIQIQAVFRAGVGGSGAILKHHVVEDMVLCAVVTIHSCVECALPGGNRLRGFPAQASTGGAAYGNPLERADFAIVDEFAADLGRPWS